MNPEILLEQIIGYTIGASELIPHIQEKAQKKYDFALLPYGPHFYTGILQSAGYLLLSEKKNVLFLVPQDIKNGEVFQIS
jgi:hypothetical protein